MLNDILSILPYAIAAALAAPIVAVVTAVILAESPRPVLGGLLFTAGAGSLDVVVATVVLVAFWGTDPATAGGDAGAYIDAALGALFLVLGILAIFGKDSPEKSAARQKRVQAVGTAPLARLFAIGIGAQIVNIDALSVFVAGLKEVLSADVSPAGAVVMVAVALTIMLIPYYGPIVVYVKDREKARRSLSSMTDWLLSHNKPIEVGVGIGFGVIFLAKGISELN